MLLPFTAAAAPSHGKTGIKSVHHTKTTKLVTTSRSTSPARNPIYIYVPTTAPSAPQADPNECADDGSNCTDLGSCYYWGVNCDGLSPLDEQALQDGNITPDDTTVTNSSTSQTPQG
jgi:hypothetical protein